MTITLSHTDLERLRGVQEALLSTLEFADLGEWRSEVNGRVRELTGADKVMFFVPDQGAWSDELDPSAHAEYEAHFHQFDRGSVISLARGLRVASHPQLYDYDAFLRGEWHNDFLARHGCFHTLGLTVELTRARPPWAFLALQREREGAPPFDRRVRAQLELLESVFRAGVETALRTETWRDALAGSLDRVAEPLAVYDSRARLVHRNRSLRDRMRAEPERRRVGAAMERAARAAASPEAGGAPRGMVRTDRGAYAVRAFRVAEGFDGPVVVVALEPSFRVPLQDAELADRYRLSAREIEVARRIAAGEKNDAIAAALEISPHTVRRHTEAILRKLDVASRQQVADRISR